MLGLSWAYVELMLGPFWAVLAQDRPKNRLNRLNIGLT